jgi:hypothetical protein
MNDVTKPVHDKVPIEQCRPGESYIVSMNGNDLYQAEVLKFHGGCWATVKVIKPLYEPMFSAYAEGTELDIKVANYMLKPIE